MINYDFDPTDPPWGSAKRARQFCWTALDRRTRIRLVFVTAVSASLAILDFIAVLMMAALGASVALLVTGVSPSETSLPIPDLHLPPERLIVVLGVGATLLLAAKNLLSWWASRRVYLFMSNRVPQFSTDIYRRYMTSSFPASQAISVQAVVSAVSVTSAAMAMVLTGFTGLVTEAVLLTLLVALLLVASPLLFVVSVLYFGGISWVIFRVVGKRSADNGRILSERGLMAVQTLTESVGFAPEIRLYGLTEGFVSRLQRDQMRVARTNAFQQSWTQTPRYVLETALLLGFAAFASISFITRTPQEAAFAVGLFLVTTARIVPSLLRISGNWSNIRLATAQIWMLRPVMELPMSDPGVAPVLTDAVSRDRTADAIRLSGVGFKYPGSDDWALRDVSLEVRRGTRVALVGSTGAGKSTLAELFLGLIHPTTGTMQTCFDSIGPDALVALVPQDVYIAPDSIRNNVALSVVGEPADDDRVWEALRDAQVHDVVQRLSEGLDTQLGERGVRLSGGEVQRIGLARALYRKPALLVLDEATSSLDAATESRVAEAVDRLSADVTVITIAHRLATVRRADLVVLVDGGHVLGTGTFNEMVERHPNFASAAALQGLTAAHDEQIPVPDRV